MAVVVLSMCLPTTSAGEKIVMVSHFSQENEILGKWLDLIYTEAFQRVGLEMEYTLYPYKRGDYLVDNGEVDGVLARPHNYAAQHPDLIRVEEAAPVDQLAAFAKDASMRLDGWESLKDTPYSIEYPRGFVLAEINLPKLVKPEQISAADDLIQGLKKVAAGRTDMFLAPESILVQFLSTDEFKDSGIRKVGVMQEVPLYAFLQPIHKDLAIKLAEVLKQMKAEGLIEHYWKMAEEAMKKGG